jgi:hypothetical protein
MLFGTGSLIVAREDWRGYLHSAVPRPVVIGQGTALVDRREPGNQEGYWTVRGHARDSATSEITATMALSPDAGTERQARSGNMRAGSALWITRS